MAHPWLGRSQDEETDTTRVAIRERGKQAKSLKARSHCNITSSGGGGGTNAKQHRLTNTSHIPALLHTTGSSHSRCLHCTKEPCIHRPPLHHPCRPKAAFSSTGLSTSDSHPPPAHARSFSSAPDFQSVHPDYRGSESMCQALFLANGSPV